MVNAIGRAVLRRADISVMTMPDKDRARGQAIVETSVPWPLVRVVAHARVALEIGYEIAPCTLRVAGVERFGPRGARTWWVMLEWLPASESTTAGR